MSDLGYQTDGSYNFSVQECERLKQENAALKEDLKVCIEALEYISHTYCMSIINMSEMLPKQRELLGLRHRDPWWKVSEEALTKVKNR